MTPFDRVGNTPREIQRPMSRQSFRPGQWNGVQLGSRNTTYIQNNFYGPQTNYRGWGDAWAGYEYREPCCQPEQKMGWMDWVGFGTTVVGSLLNLFGVGKKPDAKAETELGGPAPQTTRQPSVQSRQNPDNATAVDPADKKDDTAVEPEDKKEDTAVEPEEKKDDPEPTVDNFNWNSGFSTYAMDEAVNGKSPTEEISGKIKVQDKGEEGKAPKKFTLTDGNNTYSFEKIENANGSISYKCTGCTGGKTKTYTQGNVYECRLVNGKPVLIQPKDEDGWGKGLDRSNPQ